ncbi:Apolipoprotein/apolipophorin containing protein [Cricetulus griseus]|uniref:Apolipoprotein/apolipophorin containing protein n=1 Tax=Cricetulus griseus TaxID=10029 RepID=A0A061HX03_CRIGR|nr:Apolipoprotein/apolipophorin containing protein [Cricetulus griseus]
MKLRISRLPLYSSSPKYVWSIYAYPRYFCANIISVYLLNPIGIKLSRSFSVSLLVQIILLARGLRNKDKDNFTTYLQEITALRSEVLENRLSQTTIVQQVEQKLDDKLGSVSNTLKTELSVTQDEMQRIYAMSEALEARLSEDRDELKNICSQLETQIGNVTQKLDAKVQDTQDRVEELDNAIQSIIVASKVADHKFESRFECLEDNL